MVTIYAEFDENGKIVSTDSNPIEGLTPIEVDDELSENTKILYCTYKDGEVTFDEEAYNKDQSQNEAVQTQETMLENMMLKSSRAMFLAELPDEEAIKIPLMYGEWNPNNYGYKNGDRFTYNDKFYKVLLDHTSQADWTPDAASSLYVEISDPSVEWPEFKQPTGAHDAYMKNDKVTYNGKHYISTMDNNVYSPDDYPQGWQLVE